MPITASPADHSVTRSPTAATRPAYSSPGISGAVDPGDAAGRRTAPPLQHVGAVERAVVDLDEDLVGTGHGRGDVGHPQHLGPAVVIEHDRSHRQAGSPSSVGAAGHEHPLAVVAQLGDRVADVVEGAVLAGLRWAGLTDLRVPAPNQLLDAGHVDRPVVQVLLDVRKVGGQEAAIGADGIAAQWHRSRFGSVLADELQRRCAGVGEGDRRCPHRFEQPRAGVHLDDEGIHAGQHLVGLMDDQIGSFGDDLEVVVGHDRGDLDDHVERVIEPGHLEVHPHEHDTGHYRWHDGRHGAGDGVTGSGGRSPSRAWSTRASCAAGSASWPSTAGRWNGRPIASPVPRPTRPARRCTSSPTPARSAALPVDRRPARAVAGSRGVPRSRRRRRDGPRLRA